MELCDEYGLYVVDEANIESHGLGYDLNVTLANKPNWQQAHLQRIQRMYERDKTMHLSSPGHWAMKRVMVLIFMLLMIG